MKHRKSVVVAVAASLAVLGAGSALATTTGLLNSGPADEVGKLPPVIAPQANTVSSPAPSVELPAPAARSDDHGRTTETESHESDSDESQHGETPDSDHDGEYQGHDDSDD